MSRTLNTTVAFKGNTYPAGTAESDITDADKIGADVWDGEASPKSEPAGYSSLDKDALQAEVDKRNADLADDDKIVVTGTGANDNVVKADLVKALEAHDAASKA